MRLIITHKDFTLNVKAPKYIMYKNPHDAFYELIEETRKVKFLYLKNEGKNSFCVPVNKFNESLIEVEYEDGDVLMAHPNEIKYDREESEQAKLTTAIEDYFKWKVEFNNSN